MLLDVDKAQKIDARGLKPHQVHELAAAKMGRTSRTPPPQPTSRANGLQWRVSVCGTRSGSRRTMKRAVTGGGRRRRRRDDWSSAASNRVVAEAGGEDVPPHRLGEGSVRFGAGKGVSWAFCWACNACSLCFLVEIHPYIARQLREATMTSYRHPSVHNPTSTTTPKHPQTPP